jgi:TPP-dependent pyruvate/acetoin dehydrogenase alpha subunit
MLVSGPSILASLGAAALSRLNAATAPKPAGSSSDPLSALPEKSAKDEFMDYAKLTPAQKMRAAMLAKMGVTEEQLKAMSPDERQKIEDQLKKQIKEQVQNDPSMKQGSLLDVKA